MPRIWMLREARKQFSRLIRNAEQEPQIILGHGRAVVVTAFRPDAVPASLSNPMSVLEALRGDFDFTALPDGDWLECDRRTDLHELD